MSRIRIFSVLWFGVNVFVSSLFSRAEDLPPTWMTRRLFQLWLKLPDWQLWSACHWVLLLQALRYEACMLMDPSADDMMEDCHPSHSRLVDWILLVLEKRRKSYKKKFFLKGLLATWKQIIGRGFVFRNKVAGMFSYSIFFFSFFLQTLCSTWIPFVLLHFQIYVWRVCVRLWCPLACFLLEP